VTFKLQRIHAAAAKASVVGTLGIGALRRAEPTAARVLWIVLAMLGLLGSLVAGSPGIMAAAPRWVTGPPYFTTDAQNVVWYTDQPGYYTDPGDLSAYVNHAAADALVANAAATWNIPQSLIVLAQAGALAEHVDSSNTYVDANGLEWPTDVRAANSAAKPIAIIYDTDGSITDMMLGSGASQPLNCRQNAVTESVDQINTDGTIHHAILVLNGRCTGPAPEQQYQMQYQLERMFGRILGLSWSQTNDNVFTGSPTPIPAQTQHWPIMHPIDILCGLYSYQCLYQPFVLKDDDIAAMILLYPVPQNNVPPGKQWSLAHGGGVIGVVQFPNGQGMQGVNVVARRALFFSTYEDPWETSSSPSGYAYRQWNANNVTPAPSGLTATVGTNYSGSEGYFDFAFIPGDPSGYYLDTADLAVQAMNPLYAGAYAVGPYTATTVAPSGTMASQLVGFVSNQFAQYTTITPNNAQSDCSTGADGTESAPASIATTGWFTGRLCGYGHKSWEQVTMRDARTATIEVTGLDDSGAAATDKLRPVMGVWRSSDPTGTMPTLTYTQSAFNSISVGSTKLTFTPGTAADGSGQQSLRFTIADDRGDGRPDYDYSARMLYADNLTPTQLDEPGGQITINGMGFRRGNSVLVGGAAATVISTTSNQIVATAPAWTAVAAASGLTTNYGTVDVVVRDVQTGGTSTMSGVLSYTNPATYQLHLVAAPYPQQTLSTPTTPAFTVQAFSADGVTPLAGLAIQFTTAAGSGAVTWGTCTSPCSVLTDSNGVASATSTPTNYGNVTLVASIAGGASVTTSYTVAPPIMNLATAPAAQQTLEIAATPAFKVQVLSAGSTQPIAGIAVTFAAGSGSSAVQWNNCGSPCKVTTDANGFAAATSTPTALGTATLVATVAGGATQTVSYTVHPAQLRVTAAPAAQQTVGLAAMPPFTVQALTYDGSAPAPGLTVQFTMAAGSSAVQWNNCGSPCSAVTDANGAAAATSTPTAVGTATLVATVTGGASVTVSYNAIPPQIRLITAPAPQQTADFPATPDFTVEAVAADGTTPIPGLAVQFTMAAGSAPVLFTGCGSPCSVVTNSHGQAAATSIPQDSGIATLNATLIGGSTVSVSYTVVLPARAATSIPLAVYLAAGSSPVSWTSKATFTENNVPPPSGATVEWASAAPANAPNGPDFSLSFAAPSSMTNTAGIASMVVTAAAPVAGVTEQLTACAWQTTCAAQTATGVASVDLRLVAISGDGQSVTAAGTLGAVVLQVTDVAGHAVIGAVVAVHQQVLGWQEPCPATGRCASPTVYGTSLINLVSDDNGQITFQPLQMSGIAEQTQVVAATGDQGVWSGPLLKTP
jgi:hypothetical protein